MKYLRNYRFSYSIPLKKKDILFHSNLKALSNVKEGNVLRKLKDKSVCTHDPRMLRSLAFGGRSENAWGETEAGPRKVALQICICNIVKANQF